ncbi:MAG: flippase [Nitrospinota bacterium]
MIKNSLYIFSGRASNAFFHFLLALVVSRQMGPANFGVFSFLTTVVVSANCFSSLGLDVWMVREITRAPEKAKHCLSSVLGLKAATSLVTIALFYLIFQATSLAESTLHLLWILSISLFFNTISQTLWHYGDCFKEFVYHSVLWAASNILKSLIGIAIVFYNQDLQLLIIGMVIAEALSLILSFIVIGRRFGNVAPQFQFSVWKDYLSRSAPIGIGVIFSVLYFRLDVVMLQLMTDEKVVGFYSAANKLFEIVIVMPHSLMIVLFPGWVEDFHNNPKKFKADIKKAFLLFFGMGGSIGLVFFGFSNEIISFIYGDEFFYSGRVLNILAVAIALSFLIFLLSNILIVSGHETTNTWSLVGATILNIVLNLFWIPAHGAIGAAWATVACEVTLIAFLSFQFKEKLKPDIF